MSNPTQEQKVESVKALLIQQLNMLYGHLVSFTQQTPIHDELKRFSLMNFDQGVMWLERGIKTLKFEVQEPTPTPPAAVEPPTVPPEPTTPELPPETNPEGNV